MTRLPGQLSSTGISGPPTRERRVIDFNGAASNRDRRIRFEIDDESPRLIAPEELFDDDIVAELRDAIHACNLVVVGPIQNIIDLNEEAQDELIELLLAAGDRCRVPATNNPGELVPPFEAAMGHQFDPDDLAEIGRWRRLAVRLAAAFHGQAVEQAAEAIREQFRDRNASVPMPQTLQGEIREAADAYRQGARLSPRRAAECFLEHLRDVGGGVDGRSADPASGDAPQHADNLPLRFFRGDFYAWTSTHWQRLEDPQLKARVVRFLQSQGGLDELTDQFVRNVITNLTGLTLLDAWNESPPFLIDNDNPSRIQRPRWIALRNGILDVDAALRDGLGAELRPHDPNFFSTVVVPYDYEPEAQCPLWLATLQDIFPQRCEGDRRIQVLQEFMGYSLLAGDTTYERFLILTGRGANGKSTVLRVWEALLGRENVAHVPLDGLTSEFRLWDMAGKLANIAMDMKRLDKVEEGRLKELVSGEPIQVNRKFKAPVTMVPTAKLVFATNDLPQIGDRSDGVWRRIIAMPFFEQFTLQRADRGRVQRLNSELPGILNWALAGARRLYQQGEFTACTVCNECREEHRANSDPFLQFVDEWVVLGPELHIPSQRLYQAYREYCEANGRHPKGSGEFGRQVQELHGVTRGRQSSRGPNGARPYFYRGIDLRGQPGLQVDMRANPAAPAYALVEYR